MQTFETPEVSPLILKLSYLFYYREDLLRRQEMADARPIYKACGLHPQAYDAIG